MNKLKLAYFGSPQFSADLLEHILEDKNLPVDVVLVVTQPDKPVGKKHVVTSSPVKLVAQKHNIPCWDKRLNEAGASFKDLLSQVDLAIVFAYGFKELIPLDLLEAPKIKFDTGGKRSGFINIHPSLLPLYRGSSPIAYPILLGDKETGVSLFVMDEKMDHGPLVAQDATNIEPGTRPVMEQKLTEMGRDMVTKLLIQLSENPKSIILKDQDHAKATRAPYMVKDDGYVALTALQKALKNEALSLEELPKMLRNYLEKYGRPAEDKKDGTGAIIYNFWRGMYPWPGVWTKVMINGQEKRLKLNEMKYENGVLSLTKVQLEGKNEVDFKTFKQAYGLL